VGVVVALVAPFVPEVAPVAAAEAVFVFGLARLGAVMPAAVFKVVGIVLIVSQIVYLLEW